jgi:hypothetical protein
MVAAPCPVAAIRSSSTNSTTLLPPLRLPILCPASCVVLTALSRPSCKSCSLLPRAVSRGRGGSRYAGREGHILREACRLLFLQVRDLCSTLVDRERRSGISPDRWRALRDFLGLLSSCVPRCVSSLIKWFWRPRI